VTSSPLVVAVLDDLPDPQLDALRAALPGAEIRNAGADPGAHPDALSGAHWILTQGTSVDADVLKAAGALVGVVSLGAPDASIDEQACQARGVRVHAIGSPAMATVAEHTVMLILMLVKRAEEAIRRLRAGVVVGGVEPAVTTQQSYAYNWVGLESFEGLRGQTVGLIGLGVIGGRTAQLLRAFGVDVAYTKPRRLAPEQEKAAGVRYLPLPDLLSQSRIVSLHNRFTPETERMMGEREFALMPKGSFFVNTARGRLVDEDALAAALERGHLAGAALDVFWYEPLPKDSRLLTVPNLILTPHTGGIPMAESQIIELREAARLIAEESA
jgi:D-3-phosphoglycerate dehydrogenase